MIKSVRSRWLLGFFSHEVTFWSFRAQDPRGDRIVVWGGEATPHYNSISRDAGDECPFGKGARVTFRIL